MDQRSIGINLGLVFVDGFKTISNARLTPMQNPAVPAKTTFTEDFLPRRRGRTVLLQTRLLSEKYFQVRRMISKH